MKDIKRDHENVNDKFEMSTSRLGNFYGRCTDLAVTATYLSARLSTPRLNREKPTSENLSHGIDIEELDQIVENSRACTVKQPPLRYMLREYFAEFMGTFLLVVFGDGAVAQVTINKAAVGSSYLSINLGFAFGLTCAIFVAGPVSGAHLNPAFTISQAVFRNFPAHKVPGFIFAQVLGGFVAAALIYLIYWPAFSAFDGGVRQVTGKFGTAGIFATFPNPSSPIYNAFLTETVITGIFVICILGMTDPRNKIPHYVAAMGIGLAIGGIGLSLGVMTGFALNPARDFGPRLFTAVAGWGWETFTSSNYYFWVPIVGPILGAGIGTMTYDALIYPPSDDSY